MLEKSWRSLSGEPVTDLVSALRDAITSTDVPVEVHIGSDSQQFGKDTQYVTVLVVQRVGRGGRVFFTREKIPRVRTLRERLYREVWCTTELAMELTSTPDLGGSEGILGAPVTLHVDANPDPRFKSSEYVQELAGMCVGQGFRTLLKPDSWASSHAADHAVKHRNERRKPHAQRRGGRAA